MGNRPECSECDREIDGTVVWYRPFGKMEQQDAHTYQFVSQASESEMDNGLPFHPKCFEKRTGQKWPPE